MNDVVTPAQPKASRFSPRGIIVVGTGLLVAAGGAFYIASPNTRERTDDAYLKADATTVAPKIRGFVSQILVHDNQAVKAGEPLLRIDAEEFDARVASAMADLQTAHASVDAANAAVASLSTEERLAASTEKAVQTIIESTDAQSGRALADEQRYGRLVATGAVSQRDADIYRAASVSARSEAERSRANLLVSRNQSEVIHAKRATLMASVAQAEASVARAQASLTLAKQDQANAFIRAPIDGVVGDRQANVGDYVQPGSRLLTLVPVHSVYVVANFKETQTDRMKVGSAATVEVDALPGIALQGHVESFAPGSGSEFALLPFEPGTGNFTKIVQRVRVRLDEGQYGAGKLRPGLSATVTVSLESVVGKPRRDEAVGFAERRD
jgi:membrane fusion protein (multidrug efflux system)